MQSFISGTGLNAGTWTKEGGRGRSKRSNFFYRRSLISLPYQSASSASESNRVIGIINGTLMRYPTLSFQSHNQLHMAHIFQNQAGPSTNILSCHENDTKDDRTIALILSEEYANLDNEIARHLSDLSSVPHVPRVNTFFPSFSDASLDHQRLLRRLNAYGLHEVRVSGDGNCQFRALSDQLYRSSEYHKHVRKEIVKQLKEFPLYYEGYVPMKYKRYYKKMAKSGEWGDHVTLQAAADKFQAKICLLTSFRDTCFVEIMPQNQAPQRELWLSFWSEVHYNSIYQLRDLPVQRRPKKKHWLF